MFDAFFNDRRVIAMTSDATVDFTPVDFDSPLTQEQQVYLLKACGVGIQQVFWRKQVHGDLVVEACGGIEAVSTYPDADAYMTDEKNLPIAIRTADCVPILIFDPCCCVISVVHAGWQGTRQSIAAKAVRRMREVYRSDPADLKIVLGPSIRPCCYTVGAEFRDYFPVYVKEQDGFLYADVAGANRDQLLHEGVRCDHILDTQICTYCQPHYFSFRREGAQAGRMITMMMLV